MSASCNIGKRKQEASDQHQRKSLKLIDKCSCTLPPAFWDSLSHIWLTRNALREFDRRDRQLKAHNQDQHQYQHQLRHFYPQPQSQPRPQPEISVEQLHEISQIARDGGFDLSGLRGYPEPNREVMDASERGRTIDDSATGSRQTINTTTKTRNTGPHDLNFLHKLIDGGIYPHGRELPGHAGMPPKPDNLEQLRERLLRRRASLSPSRFTEVDFESFRDKVSNVERERDVMTSVIPVIEGTCPEGSLAAKNKPFCNLRPLASDLVCGMPGQYYGARLTEIDSLVQEELKDDIIPSTSTDLPVAPNFFLEVKGPYGGLGLADRQALHTGALGERGLISLRGWRQEEPFLDNMAHTITCTYGNGLLTFYCIHAGKSKVHARRIDFYMNTIGAYLINLNAENFRMGVRAYRNLRDFAQEQRNESIAMANSIAQSARNAL